MRERSQLLAVRDDRIRVARRGIGRSSLSDIAVQLDELIFRLPREDDTEVHTLLARSAARCARTA